MTPELQAPINTSEPVTLEWVMAHKEIDLTKVNPEDFGLDPFDLDNPLVRAIYKAQTDPFRLLPTELKAKPNWVRWKLETANGHLTKVPYQLNGLKASSTDPATWTTFEAITNGAHLAESQGIGIMTDGSFVGFDLDGCRNPTTGEITEWAKRIIDLLGIYTEITPSGFGMRVYALGQLPDAPRRFSLGLSAGFGDKVGIECYSGKRYFTVTGNRVGGRSGLESSNIAQAHRLCADISQVFPSEKRAGSASSSGDDGSSVVFTKAPGMVFTSKLAVMMYGKITSDYPFEIQDEHGNKVNAPSQSEADMSLVTLLAMKHGDNRELIDQEFRESSLYRKKWDRLAEQTITKAIESAKKFAEKNLTPSVVAAAGEISTIELSEENHIPKFDEPVITGIYRDIVDLAVGGTTIPPQFAFLNAKVYLGARMAGKAMFEGLDCDSCYYGAAIGVTGTSKGESWRRTFEKVLNPTELTELNPHLKVIYSADSGAGLKDAFFEPPDSLPMVCYVDEVTTLGHKAGEKKNPEILDTIIELADSHRVSRVLAKRGKQKSSKTHENARLSMYMCGQDGPAFMSAFAGRTKLGLFDRLYPEFSGPIEAGDLPEIERSDILNLHTKIARLNFNCKMTMSSDTKSKLDDFWKNQPGEIRRKIRYKKYLMLDMYMAAFGRGVTVAEPEDLDVAIKIFKRQMVIRQVCFTGEVPDRVGFYASKIKAIVEAMRQQLNSGKTVAQVAMSIRDFQTMTHAFRDNELHTFDRAWRSFSEHVMQVTVAAGNGQKYLKWVPMPYESEMWFPSSGRVKA